METEPTDMLPEYDFSDRVRGKYAARFQGMGRRKLLDEASVLDRVVKDPLILLEFILECTDRVDEYVGGASRQGFAEDGQTQDAVFWRLGVLGQAVDDLPEATRKAYPGVAWERMSGMREKPSLGLADIDLDRTWRVATVDLPDFRAQIARILAVLRGSDAPGGGA